MYIQHPHGSFRLFERAGATSPYHIYVHVYMYGYISLNIYSISVRYCSAVWKGKSNACMYFHTLKRDVEKHRANITPKKYRRDTKNWVQCGAACCSTLQCVLQYVAMCVAVCDPCGYSGTHCNTLQHTATRCNILQHTAIYCNILRCVRVYCNILQHAASCSVWSLQNHTYMCICIYVY